MKFYKKSLDEFDKMRAISNKRYRKRHVQYPSELLDYVTNEEDGLSDMWHKVDIDLHNWYENRGEWSLIKDGNPRDWDGNTFNACVKCSKFDNKHYCSKYQVILTNPVDWEINKGCCEV